MDNIISEETKRFAKSRELYEIVEKIGNQFGLHIDQMGELNAELSGVLLGMYKPADFTKHVVSRLAISEELASKILESVNANVFQVLKSKFQEKTSLPVEKNVHAIEQAGEFSVVRETANKSQENELSQPDRQRVLDNLENPYPGGQAPAPRPIPVTPKPAPATPQPVTPAPAAPKPAAPQPKSRPAGPDPYREPIA